jgi:hypothetical protein
LNIFRHFLRSYRIIFAWSKFLSSVINRKFLDFTWCNETFFARSRSYLIHHFFFADIFKARRVCLERSTHRHCFETLNMFMQWKRTESHLWYEALKKSGRLMMWFWSDVSSILEFLQGLSSRQVKSVKIINKKIKQRPL